MDRAREGDTGIWWRYSYVWGENKTGRLCFCATRTGNYIKQVSGQAEGVERGWDRQKQWEKRNAVAVAAASHSHVCVYLCANIVWQQKMLLMLKSKYNKAFFSLSSCHKHLPTSQPARKRKTLLRAVVVAAAPKSSIRHVGLSAEKRTEHRAQNRTSNK